MIAKITVIYAAVIESDHSTIHSARKSLKRLAYLWSL